MEDSTPSKGIVVGNGLNISNNRLFLDWGQEHTSCLLLIVSLRSLKFYIIVECIPYQAPPSGTFESIEHRSKDRMHARSRWEAKEQMSTYLTKDMAS
jgi:hypothetical protein